MDDTAGVVSRFHGLSRVFGAESKKEEPEPAEVVIQQWAVCGLPNDNLSVENGIVIATARHDALEACLAVYRHTKSQLYRSPSSRTSQDGPGTDEREREREKATMR